jgi:hypothetical protein
LATFYKKYQVVEVGVMIVLEIINALLYVIWNMIIVFLSMIPDLFKLYSAFSQISLIISPLGMDLILIGLPIGAVKLIPLIKKLVKKQPV